MELKEELEQLKDRILAEETRVSDIDIINDCIDLIESLEEFQPEQALDESTEAMMPLNGLTILDSEIKVFINDDKAFSEIIKEKSKKKQK